MNKSDLYALLDRRADDFGEIAGALWDYAEMAFRETKSAALLCDVLEREGFTVERGVAGIPTAFTATYGAGSPHIGILGEYDALSGLAQTAGSAVQDPPTDQPGHGCGHNLLGSGALAAAVAIKEYLADHPGRVTYFGCPAEEGGSGKAFMARDGVFDGLDAALSWHPGARNNIAAGSTLANYQVLYRFHGVASHAGGSPHLGRSALDAVTLMNVGAQFLREHIPTTARLHYAVVDTGGFSPNVVQARAAVLYLMRLPEVTDLPELYERVNDIAKGAALMTGTTVEIEFVKGCSNMLLNTPLMKLMYDNLTATDALTYTADEEALGQEIRKTFTADDVFPYAMDIDPLEETETPGTGSTDVGDVSWVCPTAYCYMACKPLDTPGHSWQMTSMSKTQTAYRAMMRAAKTIVGTAVDLYENPALLDDIRADFKKRLDGRTYTCPIPKDVVPRALDDLK
ncbi:MAG: amidohydrolase [Eubacteriales bacterium]